MKGGLRVVALAPMPAEKLAYALARYSRSPDSIEASLRWVHAHSSERFWEQFYYDYGHASIADLGHVAICFEGVSELLALTIEDEQLWDGQARSSRYQSFAPGGCAEPAELRGAAGARYREAVGALMAAYGKVLPALTAWVGREHPRPEGMAEAAHRRAVGARALDCARYLLPLGVRTSLGQVTSIRTLERQIARLAAGAREEERAVARELAAACGRAPLDLWGELSGRPCDSEPLAPTLARRAMGGGGVERLGAWAAEVAARLLPSEPAGAAAAVDLIEPHPPLDEVLATVVYAASRHPYRQVLAAVQGLPAGERERLVAEAARLRDPREELARPFRSGYAFVFDIVVDIGAWRDLHRHRRCQQIRQAFTTALGYAVPEGMAEAGVEATYRKAMEAAGAAARALAAEAGEAAAAYAIPFGYRVRCLFKMDYAEAAYVSELRSGVRGHQAYREVAWEMKRRMVERDGLLGELVRATDPAVRAPLER